MKSLLRKKGFYGLALVVAIALGCNLALDFAGRTGSADTITLVRDSSEVRDLIRGQEIDQPLEQQALQRAFQEHGEEIRTSQLAKILALQMDIQPQQYIPRRLAFLAEMKREPVISVPAHRTQTLQSTLARCSEKPSKDSSYARVRISSGAEKGIDGWVCLGESMDAVRFIRDSPRVRALLAGSEAYLETEWQNVLRAIRSAGGFNKNGGSLSEELFLHPERFIPKRFAFLERMRRQPVASAVARSSYIRFLKRTKASCDDDLVLPQNRIYVRIRITSGPSKGQEGWACMHENVWLNGPLFP
jgi:hypothetical protein